MQNNKRQSGVDKGLIAMFLKMSVDERLLANDNAVSTIKELRVAFRQRKNRKPGYSARLERDVAICGFLMIG